MIDTDKYEGHTPAPWKPVQLSNRCWTVGNLSLEWTEADKNLIADAPLLLAEIKRLRERLIRAYDWAENVVNGNDSAMMDYTEYVCGGEEE